MLIKEGSDALRSCEEKIRGLVGQAAQSGDYQAVLQLTYWAKEVAALRDQSRQAGLMLNTGADDGPVESDGTKKETQAQRKSLTRMARGGKGQSRKRRSDYPKFIVEGSDLVKIGWSKRSKEEYRHKAPKKLAVEVARALTKISMAKELFTAEDFIPVNDNENGGEAPDYQAYLCLAWMRRAGLVSQRGRQGYIVDKPELLVDEVQRRLSALPRT